MARPPFIPPPPMWLIVPLAGMICVGFTARALLEYFHG